MGLDQPIIAYRQGASENLIFVALAYILFLLSFFPLRADLSALYLSWYEDPTTTITIQWHTLPGELSGAVSMQTTEENWIDYPAQHHTLDRLVIHTTSIRDLKPDTEYPFRIGNSPIYRFRTAPERLDAPLRFVIGGDIYANIKRFRQMGKTVMKYDPLFAVLGGDIAYALHPLRSSPLRRWQAFLKDWQEIMTTPDGRLIPFLVVPGNHDITPDQYDLFFHLFAFPQKQLYRSIDFGSYLTLWMLDSGHFQPIEGRQTAWLEKTLSAKTEIPYRFAIYHEAAYPSHYPYHGTIPKKIRAHWTPLFEKYKLLAAFENHNHAYKRTYPIKWNKIDPQGVIYIGDGGWGAAPRTTRNQWYLEQKDRKSSALLIELTSENAKIQAIDLSNNTIDQIKIKK